MERPAGGVDELDAIFRAQLQRIRRGFGGQTLRRRRRRGLDISTHGNELAQDRQDLVVTVRGNCGSDVPVDVAASVRRWL